MKIRVRWGCALAHFVWPKSKAGRSIKMDGPHHFGLFCSSSGCQFWQSRPTKMHVTHRQFWAKSL
jgi:hypothetical protein